MAFVIGDVMGRGLRAAAAMGELRTAVRMLAVLDPMPEDVLRRLDDLAQGTDEVQLATCVYAVFDPIERLLSFATAGHPSPILRAPDGTTSCLAQPSGAPLGVGGVFLSRRRSRWPTVPAAALHRRSGRVARRGHRRGPAPAGRSPRRPRPVGLDPLCDHLLVALGRDGEHDDDVALLVAELAGLDQDRIATWRLEGGVEAVSDARGWVGETLGAWDLEPLAELAELLVSEL